MTDIRNAVDPSIKKNKLAGIRNPRKTWDIWLARFERRSVSDIHRDIRNCGRCGHKERDSYSVTCDVCGKRGHLVRGCQHGNGRRESTDQ